MSPGEASDEAEFNESANKKTVLSCSGPTFIELLKDAMSDVWPQTLKNRFVWVNGISTKKSLTKKV